MSSKKILFINFLVFSFVWLVVEMLWYHSNPLSKTSVRKTCNFDWVIYNYCPNIIDVRKNTPADGGNTVIVHTNELGQRIPFKNFTANNQKAANVFIGDSFIQADEIEFNETFYGKLAKKYC